MKIKKVFGEKVIVIKDAKWEYSIAINDYIYKKIKYYICKNEVFIFVFETRYCVLVDLESKQVSWKIMNSPIQYVDYIEKSIFVIDEKKDIWKYNFQINNFEKWLSITFLTFYEISAATIMGDLIYIYDNYTNKCYKINSKDNSIKVWHLEEKYNGVDYYINRINKIVICDGINLYSNNTVVACIQENNSIFYKLKEKNRYHFPRGLFLYDGIYGVCNTYANNFLLINKEREKLDVEFCIQRPRWIDIDKCKFAICDGKKQKIIYGEIVKSKLKIEKEIYGFHDIHSCKIIGEYIYIIDAKSKYLTKYNIELGNIIDINLNLNDAHSIKISPDQKKIAIADSGNGRILFQDIECLDNSHIYAIDKNSVSRELYMPRALDFLNSNVIVCTIGYCYFMILIKE